MGLLGRIVAIGVVCVIGMAVYRGYGAVGAVVVAVCALSLYGSVTRPYRHGADDDEKDHAYFNPDNF